MDGTGEDGPREFGNAITWAIDGSQIYGSNAAREEDVRSFEGGKLKMTDDPTSTKGLLPEAWRVKLPVFEGPLDLLLHLIRVDEVEISDIPSAS